MKPDVSGRRISARTSPSPTRTFDQSDKADPQADRLAVRRECRLRRDAELVELGCSGPIAAGLILNWASSRPPESHRSPLTGLTSAQDHKRSARRNGIIRMLLDPLGIHNLAED